MKHKHTNPVAVISSFRHINWELMEFLIVSCNIHILISYTTMYLARHFHWTLRIECMIKDWPIIWNYSLQSYVFLWNMTLVLYCVSSTVRNCTNPIYTEYLIWLHFSFWSSKYYPKHLKIVLNYIFILLQVRRGRLET